MGAGRAGLIKIMIKIKIKIKSQNPPVPDHRVFPHSADPDDAVFVVPHSGF